MSDIVQGSPLDPQVISKRLEKFFEYERQSPLEAFQATRHLREYALESLDLFMDFLSEKKIAPRTAIEIATNLAVSLINPILEQINPYDLGIFSLDNKVALEYCKRVSNPRDTRKRTQRGVNVKALVKYYPAHEFVIDCEEAKDLGFDVQEPEPTVDVLFADLCPRLDKMKCVIGLVT